MSYKIADRVAVRSTLKGERRMLLFIIAGFCNDEGVCWPSQPTLAQRTGCTTRGIRKMVDALVESGELSIKTAGLGRGNPTYYQIAAKYLTDEVETKEEQSSSNSVKEERGSGIEKRNEVPVILEQKGNVVQIKAEPECIKEERGLLKAEQAVPLNSIEPTKEPKENRKTSAAKATEQVEILALVELLPVQVRTEAVRKAWAEWVDYRKKVKPYKTPLISHTKTIETTLSPLSAENIVKVINTSIANGWQGLFPDKLVQTTGSLFQQSYHKQKVRQTDEERYRNGF